MCFSLLIYLSFDLDETSNELFSSTGVEEQQDSCGLFGKSDIDEMTLRNNDTSIKDDDFSLPSQNSAWLLSYQLPKMSIYIIEAVENAKSLGEPIQRTIRTKITQLLFDSMSIYTL